MAIRVDHEEVWSVVDFENSAKVISNAHNPICISPKIILFNSLGTEFEVNFKFLITLVKEVEKIQLSKSGIEKS